MTSPISHGVCGIPQLHTQNRALIAKLAMSLQYEPEKLWVQVVKAKYNWGVDNNYAFKAKNASHTWRSIAAVWPSMFLHVSWDVGNGNTVRFWQDDWIGEMGPLKHLSYSEIPVEDLNKRVNDYIDASGNWRWSEFRHLLPPNLITHFEKLPL